MRQGLCACLLLLYTLAGSLAFTACRQTSRLLQDRQSRCSLPWKDDTRLYKGMWSQDEELQGSDRFKACVPYILPLLDGDQFGRFIYERIPPLGFVNDVLLGPLIEIYHKIPFLGVGIFLLLTLGTRFNTDMNRNVRFSAQQAALIDVALILPELVASGFDGVDVPRYLAEPCSNFVWYAYVTAVGYSIYCNLRGKKPDQIPYISGSADMMVGPF
jgi:Chloroplast import apparatus Tic20-like